MLSPKKIVQIIVSSVIVSTAVGSVSLQDFSHKVVPVFGKYCVECHKEGNDQGGVVLDRITSEADIMKDLNLLRRIYDVVDLEDMPPEDKPQPTFEERSNMIEWLEFASTDGVNLMPKDPGPGIIRRLSREEYSRTVRDIFFVDFNVDEEVGMPSDPIEETFLFDNLANALTLPPLMMEKYFDAAVEVVDRFFYASPQGRQMVDSVLNDINRASDPQHKRAVAAQSFQGLLWRLFRRPPQPEELERYMQLWDEAIRQGVSAKEGFRHILIAGLISPNFLYRVEENQAPAGSTESYPVKPYELATRLSYFLWSTMPDGPLFRAAHDGSLSDPAVFEEQVRRMLADPKATSLSRVFGAQWFKLDMLEEARPSLDNFPEYSDALKHSMYQEPIAFLYDLIKSDGSIDAIIDADYSFMDQRLAEFYGIEGVEGDHFRRVEIPEGANRGGLMGMGSVLSMSSHTYRTSPTMRGTYILKVLLGTPPPPPPANASQIASEVTEGREINSFRDLLAAHAGDVSCAGCHKRIDPLGFALDNFDAIGKWRDSTYENPLDTSGVLPGGQRVDGFEDVKQALIDRKDQYYLNVVEQMMRFALGRHLQTADRQEVMKIVDRLNATDGSIHELILGVVNSYPFLHRRNTEPVPTETASTQF